MPSEALTYELLTINSIYTPTTFQHHPSEPSIYILTLPSHGATLRLHFPVEYPDAAPRVLGTERVEKRGDGNAVVERARRVLEGVYRRGEVCVFELVEGMGDGGERIEEEEEEGEVGGVDEEDGGKGLMRGERVEVPNWVLSDPVTEKKSTFLARACAVTSPRQVQVYIAHLLAADKRAAKATHNLSAYRIRSSSSTADANAATELTFQDCDDDGENAAGGRLLHLLQVMDVWGVLVVVSRWYCGVLLGPDRFRVINGVARQAVVRGGWVKGGGLGGKSSVRGK